MKKFTGTVTTASEIPKTIKAPGIPYMPKEEQDVSSVLLLVKGSDEESLVNQEQADVLASLKFKRGDFVLTLEDRYFIYEVVNMLNELSYEQVVGFLTEDWEEKFGSGPGLRRKILFENSLLASAKDRLNMDMEIYKTKVEVSKGAVDCKKCGSDETLSVEHQRRSADEPTTIKVTCLQCGYKWRAQ